MKRTVRGETVLFYGCIKFNFRWVCLRLVTNCLDGGCKKMKKIGLLLLFLFLTGCVEKEVTKMDVEMHNSDGDSLGKITLQNKQVE